MTLLELQAIRALPEEYISEGGRITQVGNLVIVLHPGLPPMAFSDGEWIVIQNKKDKPQHALTTFPDLLQEFHNHLDVCAQCRNNPFELCSEGDKRLKQAALK